MTITIGPTLAGAHRPIVLKSLQGRTRHVGWAINDAARWKVRDGRQSGEFVYRQAEVDDGTEKG
jgi:hypothetical protein